MFSIVQNCLRTYTVGLDRSKRCRNVLSRFWSHQKRTDSSENEKRHLETARLTDQRFFKILIDAEEWSEMMKSSWNVYFILRNSKNYLWTLKNIQDLWKRLKPSRASKKYQVAQKRSGTRSEWSGTLRND